MVQEENKLKRAQINDQNRSIKLIMCEKITKKGSPVHVAPACSRSGERSDHFGSYARNLSLHFYKRLFLGLETHDLMITRQQLYRCVRAPLLCEKIAKINKIIPKYMRQHKYFKYLPTNLS
jgi:hypothetical protein